MAVHAVRVEWSTHMEKLRAIRQRVFIEEQKVPLELEWDGLDEEATHFLALNEMGLALGTARLLTTTGQIGRMAVLKDQRGRDIGRQLLKAAVDHAVQVGLQRVFLHAQTHAEGFYRKSGFLPFGAEFMEAGIPHIEMELVLPIPFKGSTRARGLPLVKAAARPGEAVSRASRTFQSESDCRDGIVELLAHARRKVLILSPNLDISLFGYEPTLAALSEFARRSRHASATVLVDDTKAIAEIAHPLLELVRRMPSKIEMRRLPDDSVPTRSFIVVDDTAVWIQPDLQAYVGWLNLNDRVEARRLSEGFAALYDRSSDDPELRLLSL
jgi:predicted GNAT family N-acyltransferase